MYINTESSGAIISGYNPANFSNIGSKNWGSFLEALVDKMYGLIMDFADDNEVVTAEGAVLDGAEASLYVTWELSQSTNLSTIIYGFSNTRSEQYDILSSMIRGA